MGKEFDALLINPKASDSPIDLFYGDFVGEISEVCKRKLIKKHLFHELVITTSLLGKKKKTLKKFNGTEETLIREAGSF